MPGPVHDAPKNTSRRSFIAALAGSSFVGACNQPTGASATPVEFSAPIGSTFKFISQKIVNGRPAIQKGDPVADESIQNFGHIANLLNGKPFTLSFITSLCTQPVEGRDMLCDKMSKALAACASSNPQMKHVVIAAWPAADYNGGLWSILESRGLTPANTIVLFPTSNGRSDGLGQDGKLVAEIQNSLQLPNNSANNPSSHSGTISYYSGTGKLCNVRQWREIINNPTMPEQCNQR